MEQNETKAIQVVGNVEKLQLQPSDILVVTTDRLFSERAYERLMESLKVAFPQNRVLVFDMNAKLYVVPGEAENASS